MSFFRRSGLLATCAVVVAGVAGVVTMVTTSQPAPVRNDVMSAQIGAVDLAAATRCGYKPEVGLQLQCYEDHFANIRQRDGASAAVAQVTALHQDAASGAFSQYCHEVLHDLGADTVAAASDPLEAFDSLSIACTGGYAHGALEAYLAQLGSDVKAQAGQLCSELVAVLADRLDKQATQTGWLTWNCDHMLGHAIYHASVSDVAGGAATCAIFPERTSAHAGCTAGFFMEHFLAVGRQPDSPAAQATPAGINGVFALCKQVDRNVARGCYSELGGVLYQRSDFSWARSATACRESGAVDDFTVACIEGLGRNVAAYSAYEIDEMRAACSEMASSSARDICSTQIAGATAMELADPVNGLVICVEDVAEAAQRSACESLVTSTEGVLRDSGFGGGVAENWTGDSSNTSNSQGL